MDINALNKANIDNLTNLWKKMGTQPRTLYTIERLNASTSWPNRYWLDWGMDTTQLTGVGETLIRLYHKMYPL